MPAVKICLGRLCGIATAAILAGLTTAASPASALPWTADEQENDGWVERPSAPDAAQSPPGQDEPSEDGTDDGPEILPPGAAAPEGPPGCPAHDGPMELLI